ncbi:hypothetical protein DY000_02002456 [Brassica cretica]|uniref:BHLH domain-containing protein n=1 Tax=Brassica cretica TaxID=69181 RepID=A0ABQ7BXM1_BRACR|nr:hypothetical protein DY000_02002456 [Brassica cretica]
MRQSEQVLSHVIIAHPWKEQAISGGAQTTTPSRAAERQKRREKIQGLDHMMIT